MKNSQKLFSISCYQKKNFCVCIYIMVDISAETWINAEVSVIYVHENDNANKALLKILYSLTLQKDGTIKMFMTSLIKKLKEFSWLKT